MNIFTYDFGYSWIWSYGHLVPVIFFTIIGLVSWMLKWPSWTKGAAVVLAIWGLIGLGIVQFTLRLNLPARLPTEKFLAGGSGDVLDAGAGSGRSSLMVLLERPASRVVAVDLYKGYFGIEENTPARLLENARRAGVADRIEVKTGDIRNLPFDDGSLDAAVSVAVIDHMNTEGVEKSLAEIKRVLRPGGEFLLMVMINDIWIRTAYPFLLHHGYYGEKTGAEKWIYYLTRAGFEIMEQGTKPATLYFLARR